LGGMPIEKVASKIDDSATVELSISYEMIGDAGRTWAITPGGRFSKDYPGVRELAVALAELGNRALIYDRPNCGESDVCFIGSTESAMQADVLAAVIRQLDLGPTVIIGGSGGARVSLLTAARHRDIASGLAVWMISGGVYGLMHVGLGYCAESITAAWNHGMQAVVDLPETAMGNWREVLTRNPSNRRRILDQDPKGFIATMERWLMAYCPCGDDLVPGLPDSGARALDTPALVFRSGASDAAHTRQTSERVAELLPRARLVEPPWKDTEWIDSQIGRRFVNWPMLAPILHTWATDTLS
jgi:pimeloyl-ACP methyl ester carboxylesterase